MRKYTLIGTDPVPIWVVEGTSQPTGNDAPVDELMTRLIKEERTFPEFRGVSLDRLGRILTTGVDVVPTNAPIFVSDIDKAWEYPSRNEPRVIFALRAAMLQKSWTTLPLNAPPQQIAETLERFPRQHHDETCLWFSRIEDPNRNLTYEAAYGHWIPGCARDALAAVFLFRA